MALLLAIYVILAALIYTDRPSPGIRDSLLWPYHFAKSFVSKP